MVSYITRRIFWTVPVLLFISTVTFVLMHETPGGPWDASKKLPQDAVDNIEHQYGLDESLVRQYGSYLLGLMRGDLGVSFYDNNRPVREILADKIPVSLTLGLLALGVSVAAGVSLGVLSALRRNRWLDYASVGFATAGASIPSFILGMLLLIVFAGQLHWLPSYGWGTPKQAILPVITLSALPAAYIARVTRASVLEAMEHDYVRTARAKGLGEPTVAARHILRNAMIPVLTVIGPIGAFLVTGSFIVEWLFGIPGVGYTFVDSIGNNDYGLIMGIALFYATVIVAANLIVDVAYAFLDPRIRYESHG
jgi:oligopeptide transport system permease protein